MAIFKTFGKKPSGPQLQKIQQSRNYSNNHFQNLHPTVTLAKDASFVKMLWQALNRPRDTKPPKTLPSIKNNLAGVATEKPVITWFGHSSYLLCINGKNILVDPVFSGHASPFSFSVKSFAGADVFTVDDLPKIDILLLTHDHYDHLDYETVLQLKDKAGVVCTSLGVASHLIYWGFDANKIMEFDWQDSKAIEGDITIIAAPARHFSGRGLVRAKTLWSSFVVQTGGYTLYLGGDSGYDTHFKKIGEAFGPFDIAILECGQYNANWPQIHMMPEETVQAAIDLKAKVLLHVHWGKFALALHPWDEPIKRVTARAAQLGLNTTTPMIGEQVVLGQHYPDGRWWEF